MGTQNKRFGTTGDLANREALRKEWQFKLDERKNIDERRERGQFSTPYFLAKELISCGLSLLDSDKISFLEPALGTGVFFSTLMQEAKLQNKSVVNATGIEVDTDFARGATYIWNETELEVINSDFTHIQPKKKYNFVVTNPPYVRHHYIPRDEKILLNTMVKDETGIDISGLAGLYCYFILLAHKWLEPGAISGWLIPSEFMDVNYGDALKTYLLKNVHLLRVHRYAPESAMFDDALVSSCVVWFKNETVSEDYEVEFSYGGTHNKPDQSKKVKKSALLEERKWTRFPEKSVRILQSTVATIGDYFTVKRGLATGDNKFFILAKDHIDELGLDMKFFKPVLPSPRCLKVDCVESDRNGIPKLDPQYYLLDCDLTEDEIQYSYPKLWSYLQSGVEITGEKYLCKNRKKWYWQEKRKSTRFLCSYMGRGHEGCSAIRFILNWSDAIATNSYLMLYPKENLQQAIENNSDAIYYVWKELRTIGATEIEDEGRVYGGGLKKIEPKELEKVVCSGLQMFCGS